MSVEEGVVVAEREVAWREFQAAYPPQRYAAGSQREISLTQAIRWAEGERDPVRFRDALGYVTRLGDTRARQVLQGLLLHARAEAMDEETMRVVRDELDPGEWKSLLEGAREDPERRRLFAGVLLEPVRQGMEEMHPSWLLTSLEWVRSIERKLAPEERLVERADRQRLGAYVLQQAVGWEMQERQLPGAVWLLGEEGLPERAVSRLESRIGGLLRERRPERGIEEAVPLSLYRALEEGKWSAEAFRPRFRTLARLSPPIASSLLQWHGDRLKELTPAEWLLLLGAPQAPIREWAMRTVGQARREAGSR